MVVVACIDYLLHSVNSSLVIMILTNTKLRLFFFFFFFINILLHLVRSRLLKSVFFSAPLLLDFVIIFDSVLIRLNIH